MDKKRFLFWGAAVLLIGILIYLTASSLTHTSKKAAIEVAINEHRLGEYSELVTPRVEKAELMTFQKALEYTNSPYYYDEFHLPNHKVWLVILEGEWEFHGGPVPGDTRFTFNKCYTIVDAENGQFFQSGGLK